MKSTFIFTWKIVVALMVQNLCIYHAAEQKCTKENQLYHDANDPDKVCLLGCKSGCYCRPGYMLDQETGECIHESAPKAYICKENEYLGCGEIICPHFCGNHRDPICSLSRFDCGYGCFCKPGFIKILKHGCIPIEQCPTIFISNRWG